MIDTKAMSRSPLAMTRTDAGQVSPVAAKRLAPTETLSAPGVMAGRTMGVPALSRGPVDTFEAGRLPNARLGMPVAAARGIGAIGGAMPPLMGGIGGLASPQLGRIGGAMPPLMGGIGGLVSPQLGGIGGAMPPLMGGIGGVVPQEIGAGAPEEAAAPAEASSGSGIPGPNDKRPQGDNRSAAQIVDDTPVLAHLGRQKDIKFDELCKQTGVDPKLDLKDSKQNPDAVYRLASVLQFIDSSKASTGGDRESKVQNGQGDGNIEGITKDGDARHGTEAGMVKDFAEQGYKALGTDHQLPTTNDTHVKADGSNKDNFQWAAGEAGKALWFIPGVSNVLTGIGNSEGGFLGALGGAAGGVLNTWKGAAEGIIGSFTKGRVNPASMLLGAYTGALSQTEAAPQPVKDIASLF